MKRKQWSRRDLLTSLAAYFSLEPNIRRNPPRNFVTQLATVLGRSEGSTALRLANYIARDPEMKTLGVKGMFGGGEHVDEIWSEFCCSGKLNVEKFLGALVFEAATNSPDNLSTSGNDSDDAT